jgi:hypothetical protein
MDIKRTPEEFSDCTSKIIGCAMRVHSVLGNGFQEVIYQRALEIELAAEGLRFIREIGNANPLQRRANWYTQSRLFC